MYKIYNILSEEYQKHIDNNNTKGALAVMNIIVRINQEL